VRDGAQVGVVTSALGLRELSVTASDAIELIGRSADGQGLLRFSLLGYFRYR